MSDGAANIETIADPAFHRFKAELESFRRMHGYYLVDLVSIRALRDECSSEGKLLDRVFEHFDDHPWPDCSSRADLGSWSDYEVHESEGSRIAIEALVGGSSIGHMRETVSHEQATVFWQRFQEFFASSRRYYVRMGLGSSDYPFGHGTAIVASERAGLLWAVESD